jgi:undecaprenyl-diphosphatase
VSIVNNPEEAPKPVGLITAVVLLSLAAAVLSLALFGWIAEEMLEGATIRFDTSIRLWVHGPASPQLTAFMNSVTTLGSQGLFIGFLVAAGVFWKLQWKRAIGWLAISLSGSALLTAALKHEFQRPRPLPFFGPVPDSYSFPSGHSLSSFCFYGVLAGLITARVRPLWIRVIVWTVSASLVLLIGISRIYLGVHYPSDVIAGYLAALVWVSSLVLADRVRKTRKGLKVVTVADEVPEIERPLPN